MCHKQDLIRTKVYFDLYYEIQNIYRMVFMNIGLSFNVSDSVKSLGLIQLEKIDQKILKLKSFFRIAYYTTAVDTNEEKNEILLINMEICNAMENDFLSCFEYIKSLELSKK
ncbi:hypothetical protein EDEG_00400 [Edhazardia aedis USNM 41457]|uniref:Uncharacterized protein n=1 Tax=Edhazardia aedis (strain USNM 41457) TaxID=1003232 RepID=J9DG74_EDHAE|nr:hypothetical protein EDEG_00400 [Edhazardia aedis USNM 41457]|eukprot:EJW01585.1 hypothetical protein EDEG_00400 [Edhazardia aedis USNM 41457]